MVSFWSLASALFMLAAWGAGLLPGAIELALLLLAAGLGAEAFLARRNAERLCHASLPSTLAVACLLLWIAFTALPLPERLQHFAGPERAQQGAVVADVVGQVQAAGHVQNSVTTRPTLTRNRAGTIRGLLLVFACAMACLLASALAPRRRQQFLVFAIVFATLMAIAGMVGQHLISQGKTLWWHIPVSQGEPVACFVNRNHYAGFIALFAPAALVLLARALDRREWPQAMGFLAAFVIIATAVVLSYSRGAMVACLGGNLMVAAATMSKRNPRRSVAIFLVLFVAIVSVTLFVHGGVERRLRSLGQRAANAITVRETIWHDSQDIWRQHPLVGVGVDGFRSVYARVSTLTSTKSYTHAENMYIQLMVDGGALGLLLVLGLLVGGGRRVLAFFQDHEPNFEFLVAVFGVLAVAAIHALGDFAPFIPLYAVMVAAVAGLALAPLPYSLLNRLAKRGGGTVDPDALATVENHVFLARQRVLFKTMACVGLLVAGISHWRLGSKIHDYDRTSYIVNADLDATVEALTWAPTYWRLWARLGELTAQQPELAVTAYEMATQYNPNNYLLWGQLALMRQANGERKRARQAYERMLDLQKQPSN